MVRPLSQKWDGFVGLSRAEQNVYFFATTIDIHKPGDAPARIEITRRSLKDLGLL